MSLQQGKSYVEISPRGVVRSRTKSAALLQNCTPRAYASKVRVAEERLVSPNQLSTDQFQLPENNLVL